MAINKSTTEYYNLEKVAEVLSVSAAEVSRLREQGKLRGFRDGATWKFNKGEVHAYLAEAIRSRGGGSTNTSSGDSGFDLAEVDASSSSFDLLEAALPDEDQLISAVSAPPKSDLDLAALDNDNELALAEETHAPEPIALAKPQTSGAMQEELLEVEILEDDFDKDFDDDSSALALASTDDDSSALALALADDDSSVLNAPRSSPQLGLAHDSGFDVLMTGEGGIESDVLLVDEEKTEAVLLTSEDFELEPTPQAARSDDSESSSQVIAIDVGLAGELHDDHFGGDAFEGFAGFDSEAHPAPHAAAAPSDPFGASATPPAFDFAPAAPAPAKKAAVQEEEYSTGMLVALALALVVMFLPGMMMLDTMIHMWSWNDPFILNSFLMSTIAGLFGL